MHSPGEAWPLVTIEAEIPLPEGVNETSLTSLVTHVLAAEGVSGDFPLGIQFVDDPTMQAAHVEFMDIDEPTDIMTFPYDDSDGDDDDPWMPVEDDGIGQGGDLLISVDRAAENAIDAGWSTAQELCFLVAHGILHLLGWDDATDEARAAMLDRQRELLSGWRESPEATH